MQIGPRIRVGGKLGAVGNAVKKGAGDLLAGAGTVSIAGHKFSTSPLSMITNPIAKKLQGGSDSEAFRSIEDTGRSQLRSAALATALYGGGELASAAGVGIPSAPGASTVLSAAQRIGKKVLGSADAGGGDGGNGRTGMSLIDKLLMAGSVAEGADGAMRSRHFEDQAADYARGSYDARAPLRERAMKMMLDESKPDYSDIFEDPGNVYDVARRKREMPAQLTVPPADSLIDQETVVP